MANEPTFNPNAYRDFDDDARRNRAVQDLYEPGSTFKVVTASAAIEEKVMPIDTLIDTNPGPHHASGPRVDHRRRQPQLRRAVVHRRHRQVEQRRRDQDRLQRRHRAAEPTTSRCSASASRVSPDFPGESPGIVWNPAKWTESALASVSMGYQVGVTPLQMVDRGQLGRQRRRAASSRASSAPSIATAAATRCTPKVVRRTISADTAATLTTIMEGVVERGTAQAGADPRLHRSPARPAPRRSWSTATTRQSDYNASFVGFVPSRNPARHDHRRHRLAARDGPTTGGVGVGAGLQAHRRGDAALSRRRPDDQPAAAGAGRAARRVAGHTPTNGGRSGGAGRQPGRRRPARHGARSARPERARRGPHARQARHERARLPATASSSRRMPAPGAPLDGDARLPPRPRTPAVAPCGDCEPSNDLG